MTDILPTYEYNSANEIVVSVINATWNKGLEMAANYTAKVGTATNLIQDMLDGGTAPQMSASAVAPVPTVVEPVVTIPATIEVTDAFALYDTKYLELVALLETKFSGFMTTHFPTEGLAYNAAEDWLVATIADPSGVASQIWEDDRARIADEAERKVAEVTAFWAAKRFPMPSGALAGQILQIQQAAQAELAKSSRTAAIQSLELVKFAVEKALSLRQIALGAAKDYIMALASGPDMASKLVNIGYDAQSKLISAASQFYGARTEATKLTYAANAANADRAQDADKANMNAELALISEKIKALLADAQATAQTATSLLNNLHTSASVSGSRSMSVGYSYGGDVSSDPAAIVGVE